MPDPIIEEPESPPSSPVAKPLLLGKLLPVHNKAPFNSSAEFDIIPVTDHDLSEEIEDPEASDISSSDDGSSTKHSDIPTPPTTMGELAQ